MDKTRVFEAAAKFAAKGQLDKAARELQRILDEDPRDVRALQKLAEVHQKAGRERDAAELQVRVAESFSEQGFFLKAVAVYKQVLKLVGDRVDVSLKLALLYQQLGLVGDATQQYQLAANHYDKLGDVKGSLSVLRRMLELDPDNVASRVKLGELYAREQMTAEAVQELKRAAAHLGKNGRTDDQLRVLDRIGQLAPFDAEIARETAQLLLSRAEAKRALARLQVCFRQDPRDVETLQLLARAFHDLGQHAKTVSVYRELAQIYLETNQREARRGVYSKILELVPADPEATEALARDSTASGVLVPAASPGAMAAAQAVRAAVRSPPTPLRPALPPPPPEVPASVARVLTETDVYLKYGLVAKALEHLQKALTEAPGCLAVHEKRLVLLERQGRGEDAQKTLVRLVELARATADTERDRLYTQQLAQRSPGHPLVGAAAQAAELAPAPDEPETVAGDEVERTAAALAAAAAGEGREGTEHFAIDIDGTETTSREPAGAPATDPMAVTTPLLGPGEDEAFASALESRRTRVEAEASREVVVADETPGAHEAPPAAGDGAEAAELEPPPESAEEAAPLEPPPETAEEAASLEPPPENASEEGAPEADAGPARPRAADRDPFAEEVAEAEFLVQQGLHDEARDMLAPVLREAPDHERARSLLDALPAAEPEPHTPPPDPEVVRRRSEASRHLAAEISMDQEPPAVAAPPPAAPPPDREVLHSVEDAVDEFKKGLDTAVEAEDSQTHFDLGIAYKEMGLLDEAVHEFDAALQAGGRRRDVDCLTMMGVCLVQKGEPRRAVECFERALRTSGLTLEASKEAHFEMAHAFELLRDVPAARDHYGRVLRADPRFRDVAARLARLGGVAARPVQRAAPAAGAGRQSPSAPARPAPARPPAEPFAAPAEADLEPPREGSEEAPRPAPPPTGASRRKIGYL